MKMKTKKEKLTIAFGIILMSLFINSLNAQNVISSTTQTQVKIDYIEYNYQAEYGDVLTVKPYFVYENNVYIRNSYVYLFYTINAGSDSIPDNAKYIEAALGSYCGRPESVILTIPTSIIMPGDVIRFELRWEWGYYCSFGEVHSALSQVYTITIQPNSEPEGLSGWALYTVLGVGALLLLIVAIYFLRRRKK